MEVKAHNDAGWGEFSPKRSFVLAPNRSGVLPAEFALNAFDFSGGVELRYALPKTARVRIRIFDFARRLRASPVDEDQAAGRYALKPPPLSAGPYYLDFRAGDFRRTQRFAKL